MLSLIVFLPLLAAVVLAAVPRLGGAPARWVWVAVAGADLVLVGVVWARFDAPPAGRLAFAERVPWIPSVNSSYHVGVDGISLPLLAMTAVVFGACAVYSLADRDRARVNSALFLALQGVSLGLFVAADLILFFVFFDLSIVGMYFAIAGWGHGDRQRSAVKFFLYTFLGSLALLLGFIGLYVAADPHTFDMVELTAADPRWPGRPVAGVLVLATGCWWGLMVKTADVPVPHLAAAGAHRRPGGRVGGAGRGAAQDGHLRLRPHRDADAAAVPGGPRHGWSWPSGLSRCCTAPWWRWPRPT